MAEQSGLIPIGQAARLLMISDERIRQLQKQGFIPKAEKRGQVQLVGAVQGYLKYLKDDERRSSKTAADSRVRDARALEIELRIAERSRELIRGIFSALAAPPATGATGRRSSRPRRESQPVPRLFSNRFP